jgi:LPXTG-motif cell wall-anchored protein
MNNTLRHVRHLAECFLLGLVFTLAVVVFAIPAHAADPGVASVPLNTRIPATGHTTPDSVHEVSSVKVDPALVRGQCEVTVTGANNESVHPNSDILIVSGNSAVTVPDVEALSNVGNIPADGVLTLGDTITISVRLGEDGLFSGGTLVVDFDCVPPPPPTTTTPPTSPPHSVPNVTCTTPSGEIVVTNPENANVCAPTTTAPKPTCVDNPATPTNECTTLPHTGSTSAPLAAGAIGAAGLGAVLIAAARRRAA